MNKLFRQMPVYSKLLVIFLFSAFISLLFAGTSLVMLEISEFQKNTRNDLEFLATIIGNRSTAALMFEDRELAAENLAVLNTRVEVQEACLYDASGAIFAQLPKINQANRACPLSVANEQSRYENTHLYVIQPIILDSERQGTVYIHADYAQAYLQKIQFTGFLFLCWL